jgi:hypothetical protein
MARAMGVAGLAMARAMGVAGGAILVVIVDHPDRRG